MAMNSKNEVEYKRNIVFLGLTSFFNDWSSEMIFPILPAFMADVLGIPKSLIGLIDGVAESTASILKVFSGYISDKLGRRKALSVFGYAFSTFAKPFLALAKSWPLVFFVRVADRIGKGIRTAPRDALVAESVKRTRRGHAFGLHRAMDTMGAFVGTLTAFILINKLTSKTPYRLIFLLAVIPALIGVFIISAFVKEVRVKKVEQKPKLSWRVLPVRLRKLIAASVVFSLGAYTFTFFLLRIKDMGIPAKIVPLAYLLYNLVYFVVAYPAGIWSDKVGKKTVLMLGYTAYIITALGMALTNSVLAAWILMAIYGVYQAFAQVSSRALVSDFAPSHIRGTALGVYHTGVGLAQLPAGLIVGILWEKFSAKTAFLVGAAIAFLAFLMLITVKEEKT